MLPNDCRCTTCYNLLATTGWMATKFIMGRIAQIWVDIDNMNEQNEHKTSSIEWTEQITIIIRNWVHTVDLSEEIGFIKLHNIIRLYCWDYLLPTLYMSIQLYKLGFIQYIFDKYEYIICINVFLLIIHRYMLSCISTYGLST